MFVSSNGTTNNVLHVWQWKDRVTWFRWWNSKSKLREKGSLNHSMNLIKRHKLSKIFSWPFLEVAMSLLVIIFEVSKLGTMWSVFENKILNVEFISLQKYFHEWSWLSKKSRVNEICLNLRMQTEFIITVMFIDLYFYLLASHFLRSRREKKQGEGKVSNFHVIISEHANNCSEHFFRNCNVGTLI